MARRRYVSRRLTPFAPPVAEAPSQRALSAIREIGRACIGADRPDDVFQFALDRVSPVVGASFASVYLLDGASEEMRLASAYNWPEHLRPWLGAVRMRLGFGPSGEAASERRMIEIPDILADKNLEDWHDVARELEFRAVVALPLQSARGVVGAVTFYFAHTGAIDAESRSLLRIVADHMTATAEKAHLLDDLRRTDAALSEASAELERQYVAVVDARRSRDDFLGSVSYELRAAMAGVTSNLALLREEVSGPLTLEQREEVLHASVASDRLLALFDALLERAALVAGTMEAHVEAFDPQEPLSDALRTVRVQSEQVVVVVDPPLGAMHPMRGDRRKTARILARLLGNALRFTVRGEVRLAVHAQGDSVAYSVRDTGPGVDHSAEERLFSRPPRGGDAAAPEAVDAGYSLAHCRDVARFLGGDLTLSRTGMPGSTFTLTLPLEYSPVSRFPTTS